MTICDTEYGEYWGTCSQASTLYSPYNYDQQSQMII